MLTLRSLLSKRLSHRGRFAQRVFPSVERLEERNAPAQTYTVTTQQDVVDPNDGVLSFREAIDAANQKGPSPFRGHAAVS